ncbi:uncharacterized protein, partial [Littorina saxatilis]|uniref:uncharacterized protein n=1 Tax=Littorina saxatilis TaxID=31220 RepID=UPI0038B4E024
TVNVATNKTYSQISNYFYKGAASNAADGNTAGSEEACSHTNVTDGVIVPSDEYHWWQVDLGRIYPVHNITVWARDKLSNRLYPFTITVDGQTCVSNVSDPGTRNLSVRCTSVMYGRVVRLTLMKKPETLNLCELQIFG